MTEFKPAISVIVPVYNTGEYLRACLDSILCQTMDDLEIILVDDGSEDPLTLNLIEEYREKDMRIRVIRKPNGGQSSARNAGLYEARGEYVAWVDHDDVLNMHMYRVLFEAARQKKTNVAECIFEPVDAGFVERLDTGRQPRVSSRLVAINDDKDCLVRRIHIWNRIYRTEWLRENRLEFADLLWEEDVHFSFQVLINAGTIAVIDDALYYHIEHGDNTTHKLGRKIFDAFKAHDLIHDFLENEGLISTYEEPYHARVIKDILFGLNAVDIALENEFFLEAGHRLRNLSLKRYKKYYSRSKKALLGYVQRKDYQGFKKYQAFREWRKKTMKNLFQFSWKPHEKSVTVFGCRWSK